MLTRTVAIVAITCFSSGVTADEKNLIQVNPDGVRVGDIVIDADGVRMPGVVIGTGKDATEADATQGATNVAGIEVDGVSVTVPGSEISVVAQEPQTIGHGGIKVEIPAETVELNGAMIRLPGEETDDAKVLAAAQDDAPQVSMPGGVVVDKEGIRVGVINIGARPESGVQDHNVEYVSDRKRVRTSAEIVSTLQTRGSIDLTVNFAHDSEQITKRAYRQIEEVAAAVESLADEKVIIEGHTDSKGDDEHNLELSFRRSLSVFQALVSEYGIPRERFVLRGFGARVPVASTESRRGKRLNRRVTLSLLPPS